MIVKGNTKWRGSGNWQWYVSERLTFLNGVLLARGFDVCVSQRRMFWFRKKFLLVCIPYDDSMTHLNNLVAAEEYARTAIARLEGQ